MQVTATRLGKNKTAPDWGSAIIHEIMDRSVNNATIRHAPKKIVVGWKNKPSFQVQVALNAVIPGAITVGYIVKGTKLAQNIWGWLDKGTKPHKIRAKNAPSLAFRGNYSPKTKPGGQTLSYGGPGTSSGAMHRPQEVDHPGTEPREFYVYLGHTLLPKFLVDVRRGVKKGSQQAIKGHPYPSLSPNSKVVLIGK